MRAQKAVTWVVILAVLVMAGWVMVDTYREPDTLERRGDSLGQTAGEAFEDYKERADTTLAALNPSDEVYALITFKEAADPSAAGELTEGLARVNAVILGLAAPRPVPEPIAGETRADVYQRELERIAAAFAGPTGLVELTSPNEVTGVVATDQGEVLIELSHNPRIATVEVLPPDAAWGWFGVSPVAVPTSQTPEG